MATWWDLVGDVGLQGFLVGFAGIFQIGPSRIPNEREVRANCEKGVVLSPMVVVNCAFMALSCCTAEDMSAQPKHGSDL